MGVRQLVPVSTKLEISLRQGSSLSESVPRWEAYLLGGGPLIPLSHHPGFLKVLADGLRHTTYCLEAAEGGVTRGFLALAYVDSFLFGRFLVSLPYLNSAGVFADDERTAGLLIDQAVGMADKLGVRYLELRHEHPISHPNLTHARTDKVHMRLDLPGGSEALWKGLDCKVRSQVRKGQKSGLTVAWGGQELLREFYRVFSHNMRDLGTPVYGRSLFACILEQFPGRAEICLVRAGEMPVAAALLLHGWGVTEVPSASALRSHNHTCANMLMYWHLLERAVQRGQDVFDFGRSTRDSGTHRFKKQWGATPAGAEWQYYVRSGSIGAARPDNPRYQRLIRIWKRLPVPLTRLLGPPIVRGIP
jgi:FemAB-related protein (PEP-CTERM system-associated)